MDDLQRKIGFILKKQERIAFGELKLLLPHSCQMPSLYAAHEREQVRLNRFYIPLTSKHRGFP